MSREGARWTRLARAVKRRAKYRCQKCGRFAGMRLEAHHVVPLELGGSDALENLVAWCRGCHVEWHRRERCRPRRPESEAWDQLVSELIQETAT